MADFNNINRGVLFKNDKKESDRHPDYTGESSVECAQCHHVTDTRVAVWVKESKNGRKYMSMSYTEKQDYVDQRKDVVAEINENEDINLDDIPF